MGIYDAVIVMAINDGLSADVIFGKTQRTQTCTLSSYGSHAIKRNSSVNANDIGRSVEWLQLAKEFLCSSGIALKNSS